MRTHPPPSLFTRFSHNHATLIHTHNARNVDTHTPYPSHHLITRISKLQAHSEEEAAAAMVITTKHGCMNSCLTHFLREQATNNTHKKKKNTARFTMVFINMRYVVKRESVIEIYIPPCVNKCA